MNKSKWLLIIFIFMCFIITGCQPKAPDNPGIQPEKYADKAAISAVPEDPSKQEPMTELSRYLYDFDADGVEEKLELYTSAERGSKGEMLWDDGNKWLLVIQDGDKFYPLLSEYVQLSQVYFNVLAACGNDKMPRINVYIPAGADMRLLDYTFDSASRSYVEEVLYDSGAINQVFTSVPGY